MTTTSAATSTSGRTHVILSCVRLAATALAVVAVATACGTSASTGGSGASTPADALPSSSASQRGGAGSGGSSGGTVDVKNFSFEPGNLTVAVGSRVTWNFDDDSAHTVMANDNAFSSDALKHGQSFSFTFTKPGTYQYLCSIHQYMTGTVTVK